MKILQVFNQYRYRGGEEIWVETVAELAGERSTISELRFKSSDWSEGSGPSKLRQALLMGKNPAALAELATKVASEKPDVLLFHNVIPVASMAIYDEANRLKIPIIQYTHNFRPFSPSGTLWTGNSVDPSALDGNVWPEILAGGWQGSRLKTLILAWHLKKALRAGLIAKVDHWIAPSTFMRDHFVKAGVPSDRITVVSHCHLGEVRLEPAQEAGHYLYLGRLEADKGIHVLLEAWQKLSALSGADTPELVIAGTGSLETSVREHSRNHTNIRYVGHVTGEQKQALLDGCRAIIIPSVCWESLGLTAYEAYASHRPVIASRAGALTETVQEGKTGWLFEPGDPSALVEAVRMAEQAEPNGRLAFGSTGASWLRENATPERWLELFLGVCSQTASAAESEPKAQTRNP